MKIKDGVVMSDKLQMRMVLIKADVIWNAHGEELVVTSGKDGTHSPGSLHYYGYAYDLRTSYFDEPTINACAGTLRVALGALYDVIVHHGSHIHVEYDAVIKEMTDDEA